MNGRPVSRDHWSRIEDLFHAALAVPDSERSAYLAGACPDAETRAEVEHLLRAHARGSEFLAPADTAAVADEAAMIGRRIGRYELRELIARGGMGTVYRAVRVDHEFEQQVAIKLVNRWIVTPAIRRRFLRERQTLANLEHPGITRLLDGGTTEEAIPYLVMEYVAGSPIGCYCAGRGLSVTERLRLFRRVCEVVAYAHRNLVVHRDLKPGNILVTANGDPKVLDFGIAKLLAPESDPTATNVTSPHSRPLTPQYASPEQIRGESITTASDVYSLGVVLYELLTGRQPYRLSGRSTYEAQRTVCETDPEMPSVAVGRTRRVRQDDADSTCDVSLPEPPARLRQRLRGDLDAIVLKAMHKAPSQRYRDVAELADDVARHLQGQPVRARRQSAGYRMAKFVRRNFAAVTAAAIVALSLIGGAVATTIGLAREARAHQLARSEAAEAEAINDFLNEMLSSVDPVREGRDVRVTEILERAADDIGTRFGDRPEIEAALRSTIGRSYRALGLLAPASAQLEKALAIRQRVLGPEHRDTLISLNELGALRVMQADLPAAEALLGRALEPCQRRFGDTDALTRLVVSNLAALRNVQGRLPEAESLLRRLLDLQRETLGEAHPDTIRTTGNLAGVLHRQGKDGQAEVHCRRALQLHTQVHGPKHIHTLRAKANLAIVLMESGDLREAEPLLLDALAGFRRLLGERHPDTINLIHNVAALRQYQGRDEDALTLARDALEAAEAALPQGHLKIARYRDHVGACLTRLGRYAEAERELLDARDSLRGQLGEGHPYTRTAVDHLIELYEAWDKPARAAEWRERAQ